MEKARAGAARRTGTGDANPDNRPPPGRTPGATTRPPGHPARPPRTRRRGGPIPARNRKESRTGAPDPDRGTPCHGERPRIGDGCTAGGAARRTPVTGGQTAGRKHTGGAEGTRAPVAGLKTWQAGAILGRWEHGGRRLGTRAGMADAGHESRRAADVNGELVPQPQHRRQGRRQAGRRQPGSRRDRPADGRDGPQAPGTTTPADAGRPKRTAASRPTTAPGHGDRGAQTAHGHRQGPGRPDRARAAPLTRGGARGTGRRRTRPAQGGTRDAARRPGSPRRSALTAAQTARG